MMVMTAILAQLALQDRRELQDRLAPRGLRERRARQGLWERRGLRRGQIFPIMLFLLVMVLRI